MTPRPEIVAEKPLAGKVRVTSDVDGAVFNLAGRSFKTKKSAALIVGGVPAGEYVVVASKEGYPEWKGELVVRPDQTVSLSIELRRKMGGDLISDKEKIYEVLKDWQDAWNNKDSGALLGLFTDTAQIMTKTRRGVLTLSKEKLAMIINAKMQVMEERGFKLMGGR